MSRPTVLITGASTGLGLAIARRLASRGRWRLILTARAASLGRFADLGIAESEFVHLRPLDVTRAEERAARVLEAERSWGGVHVLINNAGVSVRSVVEHVGEAESIDQLDINFRAPMELTRLVLPGMRARRSGRILNISSVGGMMAMPTMGVYSASKFALEGACEALWYEVRPWNIHVTLVEPGFINSDGFEKVRWTALGELAASQPSNAYHAHYREMSRFIGRLMRWARATPESVATKVERLMLRRSPPLRAPATLDAWAFSLLRRLLPRSPYHALLYRMLPGIDTWGPPPEDTDPQPPHEELEEVTGRVGW